MYVQKNRAVLMWTAKTMCSVQRRVFIYLFMTLMVSAHEFAFISCISFWLIRVIWGQDEKTQYVYHQPIFHRPKSYSKNTFIKIINVSQNLRLGDNKLRLQAPIFGGTPVLANLNFNEVHYSSCWLTWLYSDGFNKLKLLISSYI